MKIAFHSEHGNRERLMIQLSEFSYEAFPVQIKQGFRCVLHAPRPQLTANKSQKRGWLQSFSWFVRSACGKPATVQ